MRVTASSFYNNIYGENNKLNRQLFDVNKQIASGQKIQYAHENPGVFIDTLRLDDEIATLQQTKSSAQSSYKFSTQTDTTIGDIVKTLESMKVKLVNAASDTNSQNSLDAIAKELRGLENYMQTLSNTSINGQYIFSGTATAKKPIDANGNYQGNDKDMQSSLGSGVKQKYNVSGGQLFLGEESKVNRTITTNIEQLNLTKQYPHSLESNAIPASTTDKVFIKTTDTIRDLMGDTDTNTVNSPTKMSHFYIQGTRSNGDTFKNKIDIAMGATVDDLLKQISTNSFGSDQVNVTLNTSGQIEITDKTAGSSKLDFHIVGAVDHGTDGIDSADVTSLNSLQSPTSTTNFDDILSGSKEVYVKEFIKSGLTSSDPTITIQGLTYDQYMFNQQGAKLTSNVSQIIRGTNEVATSSTKLIDVSGMNSVNGRSMSLKGNNVNGAAYDITLNLNTPSTFTDNKTATTYNIYGSAFNDSLGVTAGVKEVTEGIPSNANEITYKQLMDVVNIAITGSFPTAADPVAYDAAINNANTRGQVSLTQDGKLTFEDLIKPVTSASLSISDTTSNSFFPPVITGNALAFQANNAVTIRDPKNNLFSQLDEIIKSVEQGKKHADGSSNKDPRNLGVNNSIQMMDDLMEHVSRLQAEAGSNSQILDNTISRSDLLIVSTKTLRSDVIDTDIAEATLKMQQLSLNYQALLSNISKVSKLSLVNYL